MRKLVLPLVSLALATGSFAGNDQTRFVQLNQRVPGEVLKAFPRGATAPSTVLHLAVSLPYGDPVGMQRFVDSVSNPKSPNYRHFIGPEDVGARFGLPASAVQKVADYLTANGMKVNLVGKNRLTILADATVGQASKAFNTSFQDFISSTGYAPKSGHLFTFTTPPMLPAEIASSVGNISGLEDFTHAQGQSVNPVIPPDFISNYDLSATYTTNGHHGLGRTIGIANYEAFDVDFLKGLYEGYSGAVLGGLWPPLPVPSGGYGSNVTTKTLNGGNGSSVNQNGGSHEGDLDLAMVCSIAPLASVIEYDNGQQDLIGTLTQVANDNQCDLLTMSYNWPATAAGGDSAHNLYLSLNAQGTTCLVSSGDHGTNNQGFPYPLYDPEVLVVGGTQLNLSSHVRSSETAWSGSGGGWVPTTDSWNVRPIYQVGTGVLPVSQAPYRLYPDIAINASPDTGYYYGIPFGGGGALLLTTAGGTSAGCPVATSGFALAEEQLIAGGVLSADGSGHKRLGRLNDMLYALNGAPAISDIKTGNSTGTLPDGSTAQPTVGWDVETGLGVPDFNWLIYEMYFTPKIGLFAVSPNTLEGGSSTTVMGYLQLSNPAQYQIPVEVVLASSDLSVQMPPAVTLYPPNYLAVFPIYTLAVHANKTITLRATPVGGAGVTFPMFLTPPHLTAFSLDSSSIIGGSGTITGTVTVAEPAGVGGAAVALTSSNTAAATVPNVATIPQGSTTGKFTIHTLGVAATSPVTITAVAGGVTMTSPLTVTPATYVGVTVNPASTNGGQTVTGTVTLTGGAPPAGMPVTLSLSNTTIATLSTSSLTIPANASQATFTIATNTVNASTATVVKATAGGVLKETTLVVKPALISTIAISPISAAGGIVNPTVTVTLSGPAGPAGASVAMTVGPASTGTIPATLVIPAGATSGTTTFTTKPVNANTAASIKAALLGVSKSSNVVVTAALVSSVAISPTSVQGGLANPTVTVTLSGPAGPSGATLAMSVSPVTTGTIPATLVVPAGATSATTALTTKAVSADTNATVKAALLGLSKSSNVAVTAAILKTFTLSPNPIVGGSTTPVVGSLTLTGPNGPTARAIVLTSSNPSVYAVPSTALVAAGGTTASFSALTKKVTAVTKVTITAKLGTSVFTQILTVNPS